MTSRQASSWSAIASALREAVTGILVASLLVATGGCLQEADDKDYDFDNPNDTTPSDNNDDDLGGVTIFLVSSFSDVVVIVNQSLASQNMDDWRLTNEDQSLSYVFAGFELGAGNAVRVHSDDGDDDANDLFTGTDGSIDWGNGLLNDLAILIDEDGNPVSNCDEGDDCWP